jgi:hypothetical protein
MNLMDINLLKHFKIKKINCFTCKMKICWFLVTINYKVPSEEMPGISEKGRAAETQVPAVEG